VQSVHWRTVRTQLFAKFAKRRSDARNTRPQWQTAVVTRLESCGGLSYGVSGRLTGEAVMSLLNQPPPVSLKRCCLAALDAASVRTLYDASLILGPARRSACSSASAANEFGASRARSGGGNCRHIVRVFP